VVIPLVGDFHHQFVRSVNGSQQSAGQLRAAADAAHALAQAIGGHAGGAIVLTA